MLRMMAWLPGPAVRHHHQQQQGEGVTAQADSEERTVRLVIDRSVSALDLLDLDITNEEILKKKLYKKVKVPVESEAKQVQSESEVEPVTVVSEEPPGRRRSPARGGRAERRSCPARSGSDGSRPAVPRGKLCRARTWPGTGQPG